MANQHYGELVESKATARSLAVATWAVAVCVLAFAVWSLMTQVDEIAKAKGSVVPEGERQILQSEIGGKLKRVLVKEGDLVEAGQALVEFDATFQNTTLDELKSQQVTLNLSIERMNALLDQREPDFSLYSVEYPSLVSEQQAQLSAQKALFYQQRVVLEKDSEQIAEQLRSVNKALPSYEKQVQATKQELTILEKGLKAGNISRLRVLEMRQKLASIEQQIAERLENVLFSRNKQPQMIRKLSSYWRKQELKSVTSALKRSLIFLR